MSRGLGALEHGIFFDFLQFGSVPPESVARRILGIEPAIPLTAYVIQSAFRVRVKSMRPDLTDGQADALLKDVATREWSRQEHLTELLWAREDLLGRVRTVTAGGEEVSHECLSPEEVTRQEQERARREKEQEVQRQERRRVLGRQHNITYRCRRKSRRPRPPTCCECRIRLR